MTTTWGPIVYPAALDGFAPALIDNVDEVVANHPNSLSTAIRAIETKLGITNSPVTGLGGVSFDPAGKAANPGAAGAPTLWVDNSGGPGFTLFYTDDLGGTYSLQASGITIADWTPATGYTVGREVMYVGLRFRCISAHTSGGTFFNDTDLSKWTCVSGEGCIVNQVAHGFSELDVIYSNAGVWTLADASAAATLAIPPMLVIGVGTAVNYFLAAQDQIVTVALHGLTVDTVYYLSDTVAGQLTNTAPTTVGSYVSPIVRVMSANTLAVLPFNPIENAAYVIGPAGAVDSNLAAFDGVTGKLIKDSLVPLSYFDQSVTTASSPTFAAIDSVGYIDLDITATPGFQTGRISWNDTTKTMDIDLQGTQVTLQVGQEGHAYVRNQSGATINNGDAVYAAGASGNKILIELADNTDADTIQILGMATEDIANNANGYVALWGVVRGSATQPINTSAYSEGDKLYLDTAGGWTNTHPTSAAAAVIILGVVRRAHAIEGEIQLRIYPFTIGNNFDGTMRQGIINKSTGTSAAVGFTAVNDQNHWMTVGMGGSNNAVFGEAAVFYGPGYADNWYAVDGNKSHKWYVDPTDSHNNSSLSYLSMELQADGDLVLSRGQYVSTLVTGTAPLNVTSTTLNTNLNADLLDGQHGSYYVIAPDIQIHGFVDLAETSIGFNDGTYTFTLTDTGGGWSYYRNGVKYTISGNKTTTLAGSPPATATYFIYIDATDGTLSNSTVAWDLSSSKVPVAIVQWNDTLTPKYVLGEERHTTVMNKGVHDYEHHTYGTRLDSSGAISGYVVASDVDANKQFDIAQSEIWDEDLHSTLAATTGGVDDYHISYRTGASTWVWKQDAMPFDYTPAGYMNYDNAGTMTQGQNNRYYTTYLIATNHSGLARYVTIHGQSEFTTLVAAQDEQFTDLTLTNLGIIEGIAIWKFIWNTSSTYSSTGKCRLTVDPIPVNTNVTTASAPPGLGTMSTQDADNVAIIGGDITGLTTFDVGSTITLVGTIDDDTMATATDTTLATSESIKAYVDTQIAGSGNPGGSGSELQYRVNASTFGATNWSYDLANTSTLAGDFTTAQWGLSGQPLIISKDNGSLGITLTSASNTDSHASVIEAIASQGTHASPTALGADSEIFNLVGYGQYDATPGNYHAGFKMTVKAGTSFSATSAPTELEFLTSKISETTLVRRYALNYQGNHYFYTGASEIGLRVLWGVQGIQVGSSAATPTGISNGHIYYDSSVSDDRFWGRCNGSWMQFIMSDDLTLDSAYNNGNAIDVDGDPVTLTVSDTDNNAALAIVQNDVSNNPVAMTITNTGTGDDISLVGGGTIGSTANGDIISAPNGTGITAIGANNTSHSLSGPNDLFVNGDLEVDGSAYFDAGLTTVGGSASSSFTFTGTAQFGGSTAANAFFIQRITDDGIHLGIGMTDGQTNGNVIICNNANLTDDYGHNPASPDPTLIIHSATAAASATDEWLSLVHNQTDGVIRTGKGNLTIGTGSTSHTLTADGDLFVSAKLEVDSSAYFDSLAIFYDRARIMDNARIAFGNADDSMIDYSTAQATSNTLVWGFSTEGNSLILTSVSNANKDHDHAAQTNPTLIGHSNTDPDTDNTQWWSLTHDTVDFVQGIGSGSQVTEHEAPVSLADDGYFDLPSASAGYGFFMVDDGEEYAQIVWKTDGTVQLVASSTNVDDADTDGYFCVFDNGTSVRIRNRLGAAKTVTFDYHYTTSP